MKSTESLVRPGEWFTYEVVARGKRFVLKVNGTTMTDYEDPDEDEQWITPAFTLRSR